MNVPRQLRLQTPFCHVHISCERVPGVPVAQRIAELLASYPRVEEPGNKPEPPPVTLELLSEGDGEECLFLRSESGREPAGLGLDDALARLEGKLYRTVLAAAHQHGWWGLHAAALALGDRGLLLLGESGAGKSTLTLELLRTEPTLHYLTDDLAFLAPRDRFLVALPRLIGFDEPWPAQQRPLPEGFATSQWHATARRSPSRRLTRYGIAVPPPRVCSKQVSLAAMVLPHYEPGRTTAHLEALPPREASAALWQALHEPGTDTLQQVGAIIAGVPVYRLVSGSIDTARTALRALVHELAASIKPNQTHR